MGNVEGTFQRHSYSRLEVIGRRRYGYAYHIYNESKGGLWQDHDRG